MDYWRSEQEPDISSFLSPLFTGTHLFSYLLGIEPGEDEDGEDAVHDKINQDRGCVVYPYRSSDEEALFMVLDGHGEQGDRISEFVMRQVTHTSVLKCL